MTTPLTIGELARAAAVPTSTVRYYERVGLISASARSPANYRLYTRANLERLRFIRAAQAIGFTLGDVKAILRPAACHRVQSLIERRLDEISGRMAELRRVQRLLERSLRLCRQHDSSGRCKIVDELASSARVRPGR